jgi:hypothetical protein
MTSPELAQYSGAQAVRLLAVSHRIRRALDSASPRLAVPVAITAIARASRLHAAMRAWALTIGELGAPRLPGGEVLKGEEDEQLVPGLVPGSNSRHNLTCNCGDPRSHLGDGWLLDMHDTVTAVRDRDGGAVFAAFQRAVYAVPPLPFDQITAYVASLAASGHHAFRESGERIDVDALLHLLASESTTADHWSVCGHAYRLTAAVMGAMDMGPGMAATIIEPEIDAVEALSTVERMRLILVLGGAMGQLIDEKPGDPVIIAPHRTSDGTRRPDQQEAARMGFEIAVACRTADRDVIMPVVTKLPNSVQPIYGLANILAVRVRQLWKP